MCLSVPAKIIEIKGDIAKTTVGGSIVEVGLQLVDNVKVGDYVLIHTGLALEKIDEEEAKKTIKDLADLAEDDPEYFLSSIEI